MTHDGYDGPAPQAWVPQDQSGYQLPPTHQGPASYPGPAPYNATFPGPMSPAPAGFGPAYGYGAPPAPQQTPVLAIVGLVLAFLAPLVGLVVSIVAVVRARRDGVGRGLAIAGIVVSVVVTPILAAIAIPVFLNQRELAQTSGPRDAFERVNVALEDGDCDGFMGGSTQAFREQIGATTCEEFELFAAQAVAGPGELGDVPVIDVEVRGDSATVTTLELVVWTEGEEPVEQAFDYGAVRRDGVWLIDSVALGD